MRILAIRGANLASLERPFEINFREQPLASAGLYAIVGPTGAGKSTILDAICLALFGSAPRLQRVSESNVKLDDADGERLAANDARQLLRRGAGHGFAEVEFQGIDGVEYRARWEVWRAGRKPSGSLQRAQQQVYELATRRCVARLKEEFTRFIERKLGLGYESFTRAVLLAQGDFAKFLQAKTTEKADLLERLTNTGYFTEISKCIYQKYKQAEEKCKVYTGQLTSIELLKEADRAHLQEKLLQQEARIDQLGKDVQINMQRVEWCKQHEALTSDEAKATHDLAEKKARLMALRPDEIRLKRWDVAQSIRDVALRVADERSRLQELERTTAGLEEDRTKLQTECQQAQDLLTQCKKQQQSVHEEQTRVGFELVHLSQKQVHLDGLKKECADERAALSQSERRITELRDEEEQVRKQLADTQHQMQDCQARLKELSKAEALFKDGGALLVRLESYHESRMKVAEARASVESHTAHVNHCESVAERMKGELQSMQGAVSPEVLELRKALKASEPCPVCGSTEHPLAHELNPYTADQHELRTRYEDLTEGIKEAEKQKGEYRTKVLASESMLAQHTSDCEALFQELEPIVSPITSTWHEDIVRKADWLTRLRSACARWGELSKEIDRLTRDAEHQQDLLGAKAEPLQMATDQRNQLQTRISKKEAEIEEIRRDLHQKLGEKTPEMVKHELASKVTEAGSAVTQREGELRELEKKSQGCETTYQHQREQLAQIRAGVDKLTKEVEAWLASHPEVDSADTLHAILAMPVQRASELREQIQKARQEESNVALLLKDRKMQLDNLRAKCEGIEQYTSEQLMQEGQDMQNQLAQSREQAGELRKTLELDAERKAQRNELSTKLQSAQEDCNHWEKLNQLYGSADGKQLRVLAQGYTLGVLVEYANEHLQYIMPRYRLEQVPSTGAIKRRTLALQVVDTELLNEVRPADTLSGGETFLVSLALSLALSALSASSHTLDSLFIDEGFGSLDPESLGVALEALERLQMQGRKVGLISHVQEMNERIAVKIRVKRCGGGRSTVEVGG